MPKYNYSLSCNTIWTSFDYGTVEADSYQQARELAVAELTAAFDKVNNALNANEETRGLSVEFDSSEVGIELAK